MPPSTRERNGCGSRSMRRTTLVTVSVSDDGGGFDPEHTEGSVGLVGMRERVELVAGQVLVNSAHGKGTVGRAQLPALHERPVSAGHLEAGTGGDDRPALELRGVQTHLHG
jgi:hypothetical protein